MVDFHRSLEEGSGLGRRWVCEWGGERFLSGGIGEVVFNHGYGLRG